MLLLGTNADHDFRGRQVLGYRYRFLMPQVRAEWRSPSHSVPRDQFGREGTRQFWTVTAKGRGGVVLWRGYFNDREDVDAFMWAVADGSLPQQRELWRMPSPWWHPDLAPWAIYAVTSFDFHTSPTGSNQTATSKSDWDNSHNSVETIGGGASGGNRHGQSASGETSGGGGGAWNGLGNSNSLGANFTFANPGTTTYVWQAATGGAQVTVQGSGNDGNDSWFNNTTLSGSSCGSKGGVHGTSGTTSQTGGAGGSAASGVGSGFDGGKGGDTTSTNAAGGGGGAGGANAAGVAGGNAAASAAGAGGQGDGTHGGTGTSGAFSSTANSTSSNGNNGTEMADAASGSGGGSGGAVTTTTTNNATSGTGGNYGAGTGGAASRTTGAATAGAGAQGGVFLAYQPFVKVPWTPTPQLGPILAH